METIGRFIGFKTGGGVLALTTLMIASRAFGRDLCRAKGLGARIIQQRSRFSRCRI